MKYLGINTTDEDSMFIAEKAIFWFMKKKKIFK